MGTDAGLAVPKVCQFTPGLEMAGLDSRCPPAGVHETFTFAPERLMVSKAAGADGTKLEL
jgi:hypothetical protein